MSAALKIGAARGCDLAVLSELLPAAEAGLVEALSTKTDWAMARRGYMYADRLAVEGGGIFVADPLLTLVPGGDQ